MNFDRIFWKRAGERAAKTWLFTFAAVVVVAVGDPAGFVVSPEQALSLPWVAAFITATMTTLLSFLTSVLSANFISYGQPVPLWQGVAERALKTFIQVFVGTIGYVSGTELGTKEFLALPWATSAVTAGVATLLSVITAVNSADFTKGTITIEKPEELPVEMEKGVTTEGEVAVQPVEPVTVPVIPTEKVVSCDALYEAPEGIEKSAF